MGHESDFPFPISAIRPYLGQDAISRITKIVDAKGTWKVLLKNTNDGRLTVVQEGIQKQVSIEQEVLRVIVQREKGEGTECFRGQKKAGTIQIYLCDESQSTGHVHI